ncbi:MAG: serine/threonine-protein phosphatase [Bacteroidales bacterium]|nr:serine/threonine-protein phosphatase [Bacteroidales bacterium]
MNDEKIMFYGQTDVGHQRTSNEDAFVVEQLDEHTVLAVAIDGVGGYEGGEVAAEMAQKEIPAYLKEFTRGECLELLKQAAVCANNAIYDRRRLDTARPDMSCVLTAALIDAGRKVVDMVHVGDTRMYQYHHGELRKISHDHSLIGYREEIGDLTEEQAMHHPQRNVISRVVGSDRHEVGDPDFLEAAEFPLLPNSTFLLCSDGLTDLVTSHQIVAILEQPISLEEKVQALIDAANDAGGKDNVTVVLVEYQAEEVESPIIENDDSQIEEQQKETLPDTPDTKKRKINMMIPILTVISVLLLGICIALLVSLKAKDERMHKLEEQMIRLALAKSKSESSAEAQTDTLIDSVSTINPVRAIALYSKAIEENDFETISQSYAAQVRRYFKATDISNAKVVRDFKNYDRKFGVSGKHVNIRWETWKTELLPNGEMLVDFIEDYKNDIVDSTKSKKSDYVLHYHVILDKEGKIVSIYYDELPNNK